MNVQAHMSGQTNQAASQMPVLAQQNGSSVPNQIQNLGIHRNAMEPDILKARRFIQEKIYDLLIRRQQTSYEMQPNRVLDIVKRLEYGLYRSAATKEEYLNLDTLETRIHAFIKRTSLSSLNQQFHQVVKSSSSSIGPMIPTPGMPRVGNTSLEISPSVDSTMVPSTSGNILAATGTLDLSNAYQQSSSKFSVSSNGNILSKGVQTTPTQMIPTPGFSSMNNHNTVESQPPQQNQNVSGQNLGMMQNTSSRTVSGRRSSLQKKSRGYPNGPATGLLGMAGSHLQTVNGPVTSDGYTTDIAYSDSSKHSQQHHGDGYEVIPSNSSGYGVGVLDGSMNQKKSLAPSISRTESLKTSMSNLPNIQQVATSQPETVNHLQSHNHQQFQMQPQQLKPQIFLRKQKQHNQQHHAMTRTDSLGRPQMNPDIDNQTEPDLEIECQDGILRSGVSEQFKISEMQTQFQQTDDQSRGSQFIPVPSVSQEICPSLDQTTQQMQDLLHPEPLIDTRNVFSSIHNQEQRDAALHSHLNFKSEEMSEIPGNSKQELTIKEQFHQRIHGQDEAQSNYFPSETNQATDPRTTEAPNSDAPACRPNSPNRDRQFRYQWRWLLFLRHARRCTAPEGKCPEVNCILAQKLWRHMAACSSSQCTFPRCVNSKKLLTHHKNCRNPTCPVCIPVKKYVDQQLKARVRSGLTCSVGDSSKSCDAGVPTTGSVSMSQPVAGTSDDGQPALKRIKIEQHDQLILHNGESSFASLPSGDECIETKPKVSELKVDIPLLSGQASSFMTKDTLDDVCTENKPSSEPMLRDDHVSETIKGEKEMAQPKEENMTLPGETSSMTKPGKPNIKGVSLVELFTTDQVRQHIQGLRQWVGQSKIKAEKNQALEHFMNENSCQLCAVEKLTVGPPPIYCSPCGARIKRNAMYYTVGAGDTRHYFCMPCYHESRGETILVDHIAIPKSRMEKKKNDEETEEGWVQCDKCEGWQHQICALFNCRRNDGGQAEYTCPNCYMEEINRGERKPLPQSAVLGAKDLPRTILSDHIEQRLFRRLKQEKLERAKLQGISCDEVASAEALVVRVVSSVDKKLEVKPRFLEIFQDENYPKEFPYKSKVVLLFQNIEGVEVCLFGMYVQEYGSECQQPNHRRVYLSYLDSVKYFRPEVKAVTGEALRTFVYHEILIGYLEYCKKRGFTSCYIWACPPLKGEDYILYCHPEIQKTPKSDKLREWYLAMLKKTWEEGIAVGLTNLYDHFFTTTGECKAKVTAAQLPYFDGDYWPGAAEDMIYQLHQEEDGKKLLKRVPSKKSLTKRSLKASGQYDLPPNTSKDLLLMSKLGETILTMKEDFIMVHLQHACTHCCVLMVSGNRWVCSQCKSFQICDSCYEAEQKLDDKDKHPINLREAHILYPVEITDVPNDTKDKDDVLESEFFDTRQAFLSLCQGNHYQYDTLRRAKHSSMMVLYHLHNPTAPAFVSTCNTCHLDIDVGQGWRCEICPDYDVCNSCYVKDGGTIHPHTLTNQSSLAYRDAQNKEARELRVLQLRKMLDLLVHASQCRSLHCQYQHCRKVKGLFRHGIQCKLRASGGCLLCKKMWHLLHLHARACKESECNVPRCRDLKEHARRSQHQSDSRRRAAVMEMMRKRVAEVSGNSGS
ncbi:histone acetyltransferase HAC1-like isoform X2 [Impatiens glandulifera]|uniref:histone acetyltransferase HAC1-like isoform X2 n=1 Tax=Impatiens glandulifera TaxID=253017 RepID=UPI001FB1328D|nr:histone acetyltransferase HAC1-like isoform X2 [Impatiens glandulifera]